MNKLGWYLAIAFAGLSSYLGYTFVYQGAVEPSDDGRTAILVTSSERDFVLEEMRGFLESVEDITRGLTKNDMASVIKAAKTSGMAVTANVPGSLKGKLPITFKKLGHNTHKKFDTLALEAEQIGDKDKILHGLSEILRNCTSCHALYRLKVAP